MPNDLVASLTKINPSWKRCGFGCISGYCKTQPGPNEILYPFGTDIDGAVRVPGTLARFNGTRERAGHSHAFCVLGASRARKIFCGFFSRKS